MLDNQEPISCGHCNSFNIEAFLQSKLLWCRTSYVVPPELGWWYKLISNSKISKEISFTMFIHIVEHLSKSKFIWLIWFYISKVGLLPLHIAINNNNTELARTLLETHPSEQIKAVTKEHGDGALHLATRKSNLEIVTMLVENGAVVNSQNVSLYMNEFKSFHHMLRITDYICKILIFV